MLEHENMIPAFHSVMFVSNDGMNETEVTCLLISYNIFLKILQHLENNFIHNPMLITGPELPFFSTFMKQLKKLLLERIAA